MRRLVYGSHEIDWTLERANRKTLAIIVNPDMRVVVRAPQEAAESAIEERLRRRAPWILRQVRFFEQFQPRTPPREYIGGESHLYLGRKYRLRLREVEGREYVRLEGGYLCVYTHTPKNSERVRRLLDTWYLAHARQRFAERLKTCLMHSFCRGLEPPSLAVRQLEKRWGSLNRFGVLTLNVSLIRAPRACIDYVITHELCHMVHPNHSATFYRLLSDVMPDWEERKLRMERILA